MKIKKFISLAMAATLLVGCSNEEYLGTSSANGMLQVTMEGNAPSTRAGFDSEGAFYWSKGDRIGVTTSNSATSFSAFSLNEGGIGQSTGSFSGEITGTIGDYAVYPYSDSHAMSGTQLTYSFPSTYTYSAVDADYFSPAQGHGNSFNPAMWGNIKNGNVGLKHLGGVFCIKFEKLPTGTGLTLTLTTDKKINGTYTVDLGGDTPVLSATSASAESEKTVSITFTNNSDNTSGVFYIPAPTGTYSGVRVKVLDSNTEKVNVACGNYTIARRDLKKLLITTGNISGGEEKEVGAVTDVANALGTSAAVSVSGEVSGDNTISIPAAQNAETPVSIAFQNVAADAKITLTDAVSSPEATSIKNLTIAIPAGAEPIIDCTLENSSVTLSSNAGTATYKEVTAATAENTLILDKGVTVTTLKVKKGNVRVKKGGVITTIERSEGNANKVKIFVEGGAQIPNNLDTSAFEVLNADIADMEAVAKNGGSYTLQSDVTLSSPLVVKSTMILDLNGYSIKPNAGGLTKVQNTSDALILVSRGANLTINNNGSSAGSIDYNGLESIKAAVKLTDSQDEGTENAVLTVNGGTLKGDIYGICGNGTRHGTEITINGGTITSTGTGIYHPQEGTLTINGGTISALTGIEMRSGTLTVDGGTIKSTALFDEKPNGDGTTIEGAAVAVSQHVTNKPLKAIINKGVLEGTYALYEKDLQGGIVDGISMEVAGGTFTGKIASENCVGFIKGGTFSDGSALDYLAAEANIKVILKADCTISSVLTIEAGQVVDMDLNQKTLTVQFNEYIRVKGSLKLTNGTVLSNISGMNLYADGARIELDGVTYTAPSETYGIFNNDNVQNSTLIIKNSTVKSGYYAVATNASANSPVGNTTITLENSTFTADETALLVNIPATVTVNKCTFTGGWQGVYLRGATSTFTDCTINLKFASDYATSGTATGATSWGNGNQAPAAALTMGNRSKDNYDYKTTVTLKNTTFSNEGTDQGGKVATNYPAIYIDADQLKENQGVIFTYDAASKTSFDIAGKGLLINKGAKVTVNGVAQ